MQVKSRIRIGRDWHASMRRALTKVWAIIIRLSSSYICMYVCVSFQEESLTDTLIVHTHASLEISS